MIAAISFILLCAMPSDSPVESEDQAASRRDIMMIWPDKPALENCFPQQTCEILIKDKTVEFKTGLPRGFHVWFVEGLARVYVNSKCGFIDEKLRIVIPPKFDDAENFSEGLAVFFQGKKYGYIDAKGQVVIAAKYEWAYWFRHGLGSVQEHGKFGLIDRTGKWVLQPTYDGQLDPGDDGFYATYRNGIIEHLDKTGKVIRREREAPHDADKSEYSPTAPARCAASQRQRVGHAFRWRR
jgi:hypothetical protein